MFLIAIGAYLTGATAANAAETWRCGNSYSDQPCAGGRPVSASDPRSDADRQAADAATRRIEQRADQMERSRLRQEHDAAERDRRAAAGARREAREERKLAATERLTNARIRKMEREPRRSTQAFRSRQR